MPRRRLGVAVLIPPPVAHEVDGLRRALGDPALGRVPAHVTLVPPVNVAERDLGGALALLRAAGAASPRRLSLSLGAPATFLPANPVLYLPVGGDIDQLNGVRDRLRAAPLARPPAWTYVAHVTLADGLGPERIAEAMSLLAGYQRAVEIDHVHLLEEVRSRTDGHPGPPRWRPLADVQLGPPAVVARAGPLAVTLVRSQELDPEGLALLHREGGWRTDDAVAPVARYQPPPRTLWPPAVVVTARREGEVVGVARVWLSSDGPRYGVLVAQRHRSQGISGHLRASVVDAAVVAGWDVRGLRRVAPDDHESEATGP